MQVFFLIDTSTKEIEEDRNYYERWTFDRFVLYVPFNLSFNNHYLRREILMTRADWSLFLTFIVLLLFLGKLLGSYVYKVLEPTEKNFLDFIFKPLEKLVYRLCKIKSEKQMHWKEYLFALLSFSFVSFGFCFLFIYLQKSLPLNPMKLSPPSWHQIFNISSSFMTNTNWQSYLPEITLSYFSQMTSLTVLNFTSAATGLAAAAALIRGLANKDTSNATVGNFWVDLVRISFYLLLPLSFCFAVFFISQGTPQNFSPPIHVSNLLDSSNNFEQVLMQGPVASQEAIKLLGTNGGGYMQANSAHPYENPTPLSNLLQMLAITIIPVAGIFYFGKKIGNKHHANWILGGLLLLFFLGTFFCSYCEYNGRFWKNLSAHRTENMEGKEQRFGIFSSTLFTNVTTATSCGAANSSFDSYTPIGGMVPLVNIEYGETILGGVGAGIYSIISYIILAVFVSGLMIGRTPEYLGKKIDPLAMKLVVFSTLSFVLIIGISFYLDLCQGASKELLISKKAHTLSEMLYAYSSCAANNGSAFGGLATDTLFYNVTLGFAMIFGRFFVMVPLIILGGLFSEKKPHPITESSFPITGFIFLTLFLGIIILFGSLTFLPMLVFGPVLEFVSFLGKITLGVVAL